ncbi:MAG TPA: sulfurtransferase [Acidimicrobiales bacterium]|nr:sulfurtransferase [Acidimicrobiales bacterium]
MIAPVVEPGWLRDHPEAVVADVRWYLDGRSGRDAYLAGHLPGAVFVDLDRHLAGPPGPHAGRHPLPDPADFAAAMAGVGIGDDSLVVAYDDAGGTVAARLVWMLRVLGVDAALLDGGLAACDGDLERGTAPRPPARFSARPWPADRLAGIEDVSRPAGPVIDARDPARFRGEHEPVDPRAGHIPGAVNLPCRANLGPDGRFRPAAELRERFASAGAGPGTISYCGSGVTACHNLLALELAGLGPGRLYPGSWSQYSSDPSRPAASGT